MPNSPHWSSASAPCRLEWRPSRWLIAALCFLGLFAAVSLLASDLAPGLAWPSAVVALFYGVWLARRESLKSARDVVIAGDASSVEVDGEPVEDFRVAWRGAIVFARWRDSEGGVRRLVWWPDTLPPGPRRELRLAAPVETSPRGRASMAP